MSADYQAVQWNSFKKNYDLVIVFGLLAYVLGFFGLSYLVFPAPESISPMIVLIRALGSCALVMLHLILAIGPLARLTPRFKPLLYNRRHLGVSMCLVASAHIVLVLIWYHGYGVLAPLSSLLLSNPNYTDLVRFPFELYGLAAYMIILLMALTSHDFWLKFFGAPLWKLLHICVYLAYALLLAHVLFGFVQAEGSFTNLYILAAAALVLVGLHLTAGLRELGRDKRERGDYDWVILCPVTSIQNNRARGFTLKTGDKIAVFRYDSKVVAVANACAHQNGPLCEGRIIDGKIVCPWHGYEYIPTNGQSPAPFTEKIPTYKVRISNGLVEVFQKPNPPGTPTSPATLK